MNISKSDKEHLYWELCNMKGFGVSDFLNDWWDGTPDLDPKFYNGELEIKPSQHGWKILIFGDHFEYATACVFNRWDKWRYEVDYNFNGYMCTVQQEPEALPNLNCIENVKEKFVWQISRIVRIHNSLEEYGITLDDPYPDDYLLFIYGGIMPNSAPAMYNKNDGLLSPYGLVCGYVEKKVIGSSDINIEVQMYMEHRCIHVRGKFWSPDKGYVSLFWEVFDDNYDKALEFYKSFGVGTRILRSMA